MEFTRHSFENLLGSETTEECRHWVKIARRLVAELLQQLLVELNIDPLRLCKILGRGDDDDGILVVHWSGKTPLPLSKRMQGLEADVKLLRAVELGKVGDDKLGIIHGSRDALEVDKLGHLDLLV